MEIEKSLFLEELFFLRAQYWELLENISPSYDYGLFFLECTPLRDKIAKHVRGLVNTLEGF
jgi:hypothetical protein